MRCMLLYMSDHGLSDEHACTLKLLCTFVVQVYMPMFYRIKVQHHISHGSQHVITLFRLWRQQDEAVIATTWHYLASEAWWAHPEPILVTLLASNDVNDRVFAIETIKRVRGGLWVDDATVYPGSAAPRRYAVPQTVNLEAEKLQDLINWDKEAITEPVFTVKLSLKQLEELKDHPIELPNYSIHTQSCERAVKSVTEAAAAVSGWEKRDGVVKAQVNHRTLQPVLKSKKHFMEMLTK